MGSNRSDPVRALGIFAYNSYNSTGVNEPLSRLVRGRVLTLEPGAVESGAVLIEARQVTATGATAIANGGRAELIELRDDEVATPGFADSHLHLLAMAATRCSVDADRSSIGGVLGAIAAAATETAGDEWIRAAGYDDAFVDERRHPTRQELDEAGAGRPTVLHHRTGHAAVLSSAALDAVGVPDHPDGLLVDRHELLSRVPPLPLAELTTALDGVLSELAANGVVAVTDATHTNDRAALEFLARPGPIGITAMIGWDRLDGLTHGALVDGVRVGPAKIMPGSGGQALSTRGADCSIDVAVEAAHKAGFPVAVHVMDIATLSQTLDALARSPAPEGTKDRIEHCSLALPEQLDRLADLPVEVVTQPSFVTHRATKYREQLSEVERAWLWPLASLADRGIPIRLSSDAPVVPARPPDWLTAATKREFNPGEALAPIDALRAATVGPLRPGAPGTLVVLEADLTSVKRVLAA